MGCGDWHKDSQTCSNSLFLKRRLADGMHFLENTSCVLIDCNGNAEWRPFGKCFLGNTNCVLISCRVVPICVWEKSQTKEWKDVSLLLEQHRDGVSLEGSFCSSFLSQMLAGATPRRGKALRRELGVAEIWHMNGHMIHTCSLCFLGPHSVWYEAAGEKRS